MNLENICMEGQLRDSCELLQVDIDGQIEASLVNGSALQASRDVSQRLSDISCREFNPVSLQGLGQKPEGFFFYRAFTRVGIGRLIIIGLLVGLAMRE